MKKDDLTELLPVVDEEGNVVDAATRGECHGGSRKLHPVVHLHVFNSHGDLYLQRRPAWKDIQPGKWDTAVGGHVDFGESVEQALRREVREEIGMEISGIASSREAAKDGQVFRLGQYVFDSVRERELVFVHVCTFDGELHPSDELDGGRFWTHEELLAARGRGVLTPNFEQEADRLGFFD